MSASQVENCISEVRAFQSAKKLNECHRQKSLFGKKYLKNLLKIFHEYLSTLKTVRGCLHKYSV